MRSPRAQVTASISAGAAVDAIEDMVDAPDFDPRQWSLWTAERLERMAKRIREGLAGKAQADAPAERIRAERDALIAAWPHVNAANYVYQTCGAWYTRDDHKRPYPTREAAVLAAIGLGVNEEEGRA